AEAVHVLANGDRLLLGIRHRPGAFFERETLPVGARDLFRRRFSRFAVGHFSSHATQKQSPPNPGIERAAWPFQYIREMAPEALGQRQIFRAHLAPHLVGLELEVDLLALVEA